MIGQQYVVQQIPVSSLNGFTKVDVEEILTLALEGKSEEKALINTWMTVGHRPIFSCVLAFLGEDTDVSGGTMANPKRPPEWLYVFQEKLEYMAVDTCKYYLCVPYSEEELRFRCFLNYLCIVGAGIKM